MKKVWISVIAIFIILCAIITGVIFYQSQDKRLGNVQEKNEVRTSEKITDECTEEWEELQEEAKLDSQEANSQEEKISPNCSFTLRKYYDTCGHTVNEYLDLPEKLINMTEEQLKQQVTGWEVQKFSSNEIVLYREYDTECGQHFVLKEDNGMITVYQINEQGEETVFERTEIAVDYLTETDKINIEKGLKVYGKEALNQILEDFE